MTAENPSWQREVQGYIPKWGTRVPITFDEIFVPMFDMSGRPLFETEDTNPAQVPFAFSRNRNDGGRRGREVNSSAYVEILRVLPETLGLVSHLRDAIHPYGEETTPDDVPNVLNAVVGLPTWLVLRADTPTKNGEISPYVAAAAKAGRGATFPFDQYQLSKLNLGDLSEPVPSDDVLTHKGPYVNHVFNQGLLVAEEGNTACPASRSVITQFTNVLFDAPAGKKNEMGIKLGLSPDEIQRVASFGAAVSEATTMSEVFGMAITIPSVAATLGTGFIERYLGRMNVLQRNLNESLGRTPPPQITRIDLFSIDRPSPFLQGRITSS